MRFISLAVASALLWAPACGDDNASPTSPELPTITAAVVAGDDFSTLEAALTAAELTETLAGEGPFTVFAPTDAAFEALPDGALEALLADKAALTDVLTYHVVSGAVASADVVNLEEATALNGDTIDIAVVDGKVVLNGEATVTITDIAASNGVIHVIDAVLLPPEEEPATIAAIVAADTDFSTLKAALDAAELTETLSGEGEFTVFAPTNAAFEALPPGAVEALLADKDALADVLLYHTVEGLVPSSEVVTLSEATALNGDVIDIAVVDGKVVLNGEATVTVADVTASNGVIHVIDAVLLPPEEPRSIAAIVAAEADFSTLATALDAAELTATLAGEGEFTVFAPTNAAFAALPEGALEGLLGDKEALADVLTYHVAEGVVAAAEVLTLTEVSALNGDIIEVAVVDGKVVLNGTATVTVTDIAASNGVVHVIDAVLLPPGDAPQVGKIPEVLTEDGRFSTLLAAVAAADLGDALSGEDELTVFAPTDAAFEALPAGTVEALLADIPALTDILTYHVVRGDVRAETVVELKRATALNGVDIAIAVVDGAVILNGSVRVTTTDLVAANGVIHVIDAVLLPPQSITAIASADARFETLVAALVAADLDEALAGPGPFTVFAPTDDAFAALPAGTVETLLQDIPALTAILQAHVASGRVYSDAVVAASPVATLNSAVSLAVTVEGDKVFVAGAEVILTDIIARNGVIHVIDAVIVPQ